MLPYANTGLVPVQHLWRKNVLLTTKSQIKYSHEDNEIGNASNYALGCAQERLADRMIGESARVLNKVKDTTSEWQREVNHKIQNRLDEVQFMYDELVKQRNIAAFQDEAIQTSCKRIDNALDAIRKAISTCQQCLTFRECRIGIDLCVDEVEKQLLQELKTTIGAQSLLETTKRETTEKLRTLREAIYLLDQDIKQKQNAILIDNKNMQLREESSTLGQENDLSKILCKYTLSEWEETSANNIKKNSKELNNATSLRAYIDLVLKQVHEDLCNQISSTNFAFKRHIEQTKIIKHKLEEGHRKCTESQMKISENIRDFENQIADQQRSLLLCQTRLSNRGRRLNEEQTCDLGQQALYRELEVLQTSLCLLKQKLDENKGVLRYLMSTILLEEEEINIKANTLKIEEVECMTLRQTLTFATF